MRKNISKVNRLVVEKTPRVTMGASTSYNWVDDPKRLLFTLSKYKFVAKVLSGKRRVLEIGCGDAFPSYIVSKEVANLVCVDIDQNYIVSAKETVGKYSENMTFEKSDFLCKESLGSLGRFDGVYMLDVLEHIPKSEEELFISNIISILDNEGVLIVGMPSVESQIYASKLSKLGHINCKTTVDLKKLFERFFKFVITFGANDELIHTGYEKMRHYNLVVCTNIKTMVLGS